MVMQSTVVGGGAVGDMVHQGIKIKDEPSFHQMTMEETTPVVRLADFSAMNNLSEAGQGKDQLAVLMGGSA